jgi:signal transduction histidine kinase
VKFVETDSYDWDDQDALQAYRIVQELMSNAMKHAKAKNITVSIIWMKSGLEISVQDDGIGFQLGNHRKGVGWWNIEQRAKRLKAEIRMGKTSIEVGTQITLIIPLKNGKGKN